jgi:hypothetical protein
MFKNTLALEDDVKVDYRDIRFGGAGFRCNVSRSSSSNLMFGAPVFFAATAVRGEDDS